MVAPTRRTSHVLLLVAVLGSIAVLTGCGGGVRGADERAVTPEPSTTAPVDAGDRDPVTTDADAPPATTEPPVADTTVEREVPAPERPGDLGDDPELDALADECFGGDLAACDRLFFNSDADSAYEAYGDSCGGRNEPAGLCVTLYGRDGSP